MIGISENSSLEVEVLEGIISNMLAEKVPMSSMQAEKVHMDRTGILKSLQSHRDNLSPREDTMDNTMEILTLLQEVKQNLPTSGVVQLDKRSLRCVSKLMDPKELVATANKADKAAAKNVVNKAKADKREDIVKNDAEAVEPHLIDKADRMEDIKPDKTKEDAVKDQLKDKADKK